MADTKATAALARFHTAQSNPLAGYTTALAEVRSGRKVSHWIWYIFPQLRGLGSSSMAERYGIADAAEAEAYLRDPALGPRLAEITRALEMHVCDPRAPQRLVAVLGHIDALKVVSSMTLFREIARRLETGQEPWMRAFRESTERVLEAAAREGFQPCSFTRKKLSA